MIYGFTFMHASSVDILLILNCIDFNDSDKGFKV